MALHLVFNPHFRNPSSQQRVFTACPGVTCIIRAYDRKQLITTDGGNIEANRADTALEWARPRGNPGARMNNQSNPSRCFPGRCRAPSAFSKVIEYGTTRMYYKSPPKVDYT